jgi:DNA polymerase
MPRSIDATDFLPESRNLTALRAAAADCRGCDLYRRATQTVFGEGPRRAQMLLVGEQPGDQEDTTGRPFVGPAGRLLDDTLDELGIDRKAVYVTNAVKHFKWVARGKRRLHAKPSARQVNACRPWLEAEMEAVRPLVVVCLGATAAQSLLGRAFRLTQQRGRVVSSPWADAVVATYHPSAILRAADDDERRRRRRQFTSDLKRAAKAAAAAAGRT